MKKFTFTIIAMVLFSGLMVAQSLLPAVFTYSHKKTSYVTLKNGKTIEGTIKDLDRKKGVIEEVKIEDGNGKKHKLSPDDINYMYLPASGLDKLGNSLDFLTDANRWDNDDLDQGKISQGYTYIEQSMTMINKKKRSMLMQLLNPHFSNKIKVYHDPWAKETIGVGIGPVTLAGGLDKSYYVKKNGAPAAIRLKKKNYDEEFKGFYSSCSAVAKLKPQWSDFVSHVHTFSTDCK